MRLKSIFSVLIILGFLAGCTFPGALPPFLGFLGTATPTPTDTATVTPTATSTETQTFTPTSTYTRTYTSTYTPSPTFTVTASQTPSRTPSRTFTFSPSPSLTFTSVATLAPSFTPIPPDTETNLDPSVPTATLREPPVSSECTLTHNGDFEQQLYVLINNERANAGLEPLTVNNALETSAGYHSDDMAVNQFMSHIGSDGSTFWERAVQAGYTGHWGGEIIMGGSSPEAAVAWWMNDAPHRDMILSDTNDFGAGYAHCSRSYFTVDFGHR